MIVERDPKCLQKNLIEIGKEKSIGFIPTMGALHFGHLSIVEKARQENSFVVVSLFINPTQFDNYRDFKTYPSQQKEDIRMLEEQDVDLVFCPQRKSLYPDDYNYKVIEEKLSHKLCGQSRPGHFIGVLTVVLKLLNLIRPNRAYFGEKDYQQLWLIKRMVEAFFIPTEIIHCPTSRDQDGLALSSRNQNLSPQGIQKARAFASALRDFKTKDEIKEKLFSLGIEIDYIEEMGDRRFAAVRIENVRLIDNVQL